MRNRSTAAPESATIPIQRYDLERVHRFGVGVPTFIPKDNGRYVKYEDHVAQLRAHELHNEMQLLMRKAVGEKLTYALVTIAAKDAEIAGLRGVIRKIKDLDIKQAVSAGLVLLTMPLDIRREMEAALTQQEQV